MKKISAGVLFIFFVFILNSCEEDNFENSIDLKTTIDLKDVKKAFKDQFEQQYFSNLGDEPLWDEAKTVDYLGKIYLEVPFKKFKNKDIELSTSLSYDMLLASTNRSNRIELNVAHFYAQEINKSNFSANNLSIENLEIFNGFVTIFDLKKRVLDLKRYNHGEESSKQYNFKERTNNAKRVSDECEMVIEETYTRTCWYWLDENGNPVELSHCEEWFLSGIYEYESCPGEGVSSGGATMTTIDRAVQIIDSLTGKSKCIFDKLKNSSTNFAEAIQQFDGEFPVSHLKLENTNALNSNVNAQTLPPSNYLITIQLNENNFNRPNLSIARTIIHETIHAEMFRKIMSIIENGGDLDGMTASEWTQKLSNGDYPGIYDYYSRFGVNDMDHQQMAAHFRTTISDMLEDYQPGLSQNIYDALAWTGLKNTVTWDALTPAEQLAINNATNNFNSIGGQNCN